MTTKKQRIAAMRGPYLRSISLRETAQNVGYPWDLVAVRHMSEINFEQPITFFVGDNGSGKSTLVEAVAIATGFNPEGGNRHHTLDGQKTVSPLAAEIELGWASIPRHGWFLRAESFYNVASFIENDYALLNAFDGPSFHEQSHGESFIDLAIQRFVGNGFFVLDEPEAALSFQGCLRLMTVINDALIKGAQFVIATHSPLLLSFPNASIYELDSDGFRQKQFDEVESIQLWRSFLDAPERFLRHLFD